MEVGTPHTSWVHGWGREKRAVGTSCPVNTKITLLRNVLELPKSCAVLVFVLPRFGRILPNSIALVLSTKLLCNSQSHDSFITEEMTIIITTFIAVFTLCLSRG